MAAELLIAPLDAVFAHGLLDAAGRPKFCIEVIRDDARPFRLPIVNLFDIDGDETEDPAEACSFVAPYNGQFVSDVCDLGDIQPIVYD